MTKIFKILEKIFDFMASIKLAVVVILSLAVISAVGTIYESLYDRVYAQKLVYHSFWMWFVMALLAVNITAVMFDRWPWKKHHSAFVLAHIGILILLLGSVITYVFGIDGSMTFEIGGSNRYVMLQKNEFVIYSSLDGNQYRVIHQEPVEFFGRDFTKKPYKVKLSEGDVEVVGYSHFAIAQRDLVPAPILPATDGVAPKLTPAVQFLLEGAMANQSGWLYKDRSKLFDNFQMGPASVTLAGEDYQRIDENEIVFRADGDELSYEIYKSGQDKATDQGVWQEGMVIQTGWMDFKVRVLKFLPNADVRTLYTPRETPSSTATSAIKIRYQGKDYDVGLNSPLKIFESDRVNVISWGSIRQDIGFDMQLVDFAVGRYQGTNKAMTYESVVRIEGDDKEHVISMNEPLKRNGLTFYQSSFQEDPATGKPTHSVFSVNRDPGRGFKYFGSLLIALGTIMLFYFKKVYVEKATDRRTLNAKKTQGKTSHAI